MESAPVTEEVMMNLALAETEDLFRERFRCEFNYLLNKDDAIKRELDRMVKQSMRRYKRQVAAKISEVLDSLIYSGDTQ